MCDQLLGKVAIVTGSSSGIGEATAILLAKRGASVTLCGRNQERLDAALDKCVQESGGLSERFLTVIGDVVQIEVQEKIIGDTVAKFGRLDILVANHGISKDNGTWDGVTEEHFDVVMNTNLKSTFFLIQRAIPHLSTTKGNIVTTSSVVGHISMPINFVYAMTKAAMDHMTKTLAIALAPKGVRVNSIAPGAVETMIHRDLKSKPSGFVDIVNNIIPLKRYGSSEEMAEAIAFLATDATSSYITGIILNIDGAFGLVSAMDMLMSAMKENEHD